jgi:hypothetical protein
MLDGSHVSGNQRSQTLAFHISKLVHLSEFASMNPRRCTSPARTRFTAHVRGRVAVPSDKRSAQGANVRITMDGVTGDYLAVPMAGPQHDYLMTRFPMRFRYLLQMGFPPRYFLRLDPIPLP